MGAYRSGVGACVGSGQVRTAAGAVRTAGVDRRSVPGIFCDWVSGGVLGLVDSRTRPAGWRSGSARSVWNRFL